MAKLLYLAVTRRFLGRLVSVAVKGPSSGGKSYLTERVLGFFPESAFTKTLLDKLRNLGISFRADGEMLHVDAPADVFNEDLRTELAEHKPKILKLLEWEQHKLQGDDHRGLLVRWSEYPTRIKLHDPTTGDWHEVKASECLPSVVKTADKYRKEKGGTAGGVEVPVYPCRGGAPCLKLPCHPLGLLFGAVQPPDQIGFRPRLETLGAV